MKFQVGRFTCEMSRDASGEVKVEWQPRQPLYLNRAERFQYQAGRAAFLEQLGARDRQPHPVERRGTQNLPRKLGGPNRIFMAMALAALVTGCARGGGIGLEAMLADHNCEQAGYRLGTPEYRACRMELSRQSAINNAAMQAFYARQAELARQNQPKYCSYSGTTIGGITSGSVSCP